jgi:2-oxoglutarate ferredoxin oxidoreductase subunit beta
MSYFRPTFRHPQTSVNALGYTRREYEGALSTLCAGCGHDSVSAAIIQACFELNLEPHRIAKLSGIGCSSKTPTYFLGRSHGFNAVHGRMPSVATGAYLANRDLTYIGISGDGDSASIGLGQFLHIVRKNVKMLYVVENNGCYGLTKGQDSATADVGSTSRMGSTNPYEPIDLAMLAIQLGATFVARSFSGDKRQLIPLLKAALKHDGFAFIDVISPCVTFNNNKGSTKSYDFVREHAEATSVLDFVPEKDEILLDQAAGSVAEVEMHDGTLLRFQKIAEGWDPFNRMAAVEAMEKARMVGNILTGLLYLNTETRDLHKMLGTTAAPLNSLKEDLLCPGSAALEALNQSHR